MSNVRCFIQPTPIVTSSSVQAKCESHLFKRLKWISKSQLSENQSPSTLGRHVKECVVSNSYIAFLLDDGRVYRQKFGQSSSEDLCSDEESTYNLLTPEHRNGRDFHSPATVSRLNAELQSARSSRSTPGHHRLRPIVRSRERRAMAERWGALSGTGEVPEELIDQAMNVLQGKSREVVRRELMRTNLDVNLAVNNLLSHEDDVPDDQDGEESLPVIPSGDDLLSFLASSGANHRIAAAMDDETSAIEGAMTTALRRYHEEEQLYNETSSVVTSGHVSKKKKKKMATGGGSISTSSSNVTIPQLCFHGDVEWLCYNMDDGEAVLFAHIASLYSELIAVTVSGQLCQWKWANARPYEEGKLRHPRTSDLGLVAEEVKLISANLIRATVLTESLKFAVFYDETVAGSTGLLEHRCTSLIDLNTQQSVLSLQTSSLFSAVLTNNGKIYWWGVLPFGEQKQQLEKWQEDRLNDRSFDRKEIKEGDKVMMRSRPLCSVGMKAVVLKHSCPVVGVLQESVFSLHEKYRFKLSHSSSAQSCESTPIRAGVKRSAPEEEEGLGEVVCTMNDVIMIEDGQCATGTVLKVDGVYAAVSFSSSEGDKDVHSILGGCRLFRIDQLTSSSANQLPSPFQLTPKKLKLPSACKALAMSVDHSGITVILSTSNGIIRCANVSLLGGVVSEKGYFPQIQMNYFTKQNKLKLHSMLPGVWLLEDENGGLFPVSKDHIGGIKDFPFIPLSPIECIGISRISNKTSVVCVVTKEQPLINSILSNTKQFHSLLLTAYDQGPNSDMFKERCAGDYNFLHLLSCCFLPPPITVAPHLPVSQHSGRHSSSREGIRDLMRRANYLAAMGFVGSVSSAGHHQENEEDVHYHDNPTVTSEQLAFMLQEDCKENKICQQVLLHLLHQRNIEGDTPFMTAVRCRNYPTAIKLLKISLLLTSHDPSSGLLSMLYPDGSHSDDNPLFVLCHNEPCSYTWTGRDHIMQDVYECYNCGLTGSLCCCTECAFTCHRGHNCGFKRVSPSAYCDCSEKCSCHSLTEGSNSSRLELFKLLLDNSNLANNQNSRGEHIFDLLVSMEARSNHDHVPWHVSRSEGRRTKPDDGSMFVRKALIHVIKQWNLVKPSLAAGLEPGKPVSSHQGNSEGHWLLTVAEQNKILYSQSEVQHLDVLVYALTAKLPRMYLNMLTDTITKSYLAKQDETVALIRRFIRSIGRVFLVVWLDNLSLSSRDHLSSSEHCNKISVPAAMERCTSVFESFSSLAIPELAQMCNALVSPITLGTYMSCPQSSVNEKPAKLAGELFKLPPVSLLRRNLDQSSTVLPEVGVATDDASDDETTVAISNRERLGGALLPYFRSVLCSSGESSVDELEDSSSDSEHEAAMDVDDRPTVISTHPKDEHWAIQTSNKSHHTEFASNNSAILLSKAFERLLREVTSLLSFQHGMKGKSQLPGKIPVDSVHEDVVWGQLQGIWRWLGAVMDTMECQLRTGEAILSSSLAQQGNSAKKSQQSGRRMGESAVNDGKGLFSQYMLSVLCWHTGEHAYHPPVLDIMNMEHVAWILDGLLHFMMHSGLVSTSSSHFPQLGHELKQQDDAATLFFTRSASVSCLGMPPISPFASISQSLPLAEWPQLLTAKASRDLLFHTSTQCLEVWPNCSLTAPPIASLISKPLMTSPNDTTTLTSDDTWGVTSNYLGASVFIGRWCMSCDLLHQAFGSHLRGDRKSVLGILGGFRVVEKLFHRDMEQYENNGSYKDSTEMLVSRESSKLLSQVLEFFYNQRKAHPHSMTSLLAHVKVVFVDEPGQGTGVTRSLLTAVASCLLTEKRLPSLNHIYEQGGKSIVPAYSQLFGAEQNSNEDASSPTKWLLGHESSPHEQDDGQGPLFYQPSRSGFYAIHHGTLTMARLEAFHTVGNLIGYSLMMREMFPLPLCRHILKYILQQPVCWEDFAFFDPIMYETFRQLLLDAKKEMAISIFDSMALTFHVALSKEEGGHEYDLIPNGALQPVTPENVLHYVSRYAYLRMVYVIEEPLQRIVEGIRDVIPNNCSSFSMLTPEDLRLLLNGTCQVDIELLKSITTFSDESHKNNELIEQFKGWFWLLVERMNNKERQDLLYFWTSSPVTPPTPEGYHPIPTITIRPMDDHHLPTANTCISRLYIPLYSSKSILKNKLLLAIKTKYFGFV